jgi:hypothetical protein
MERMKQAFQSLPSLPSIPSIPEPEEQSFLEKVADGLTYNLYSVIYRTAKNATFCPMDICITCIMVFSIIAARFTYLVFAYVFNFFVWFFYTLVVMSPGLVILFLLVIAGVVIYYLSESVRSILNIIVTPLWNVTVQGLSGLSGVLSILIGALLMIPKIIGINIPNPLSQFGPEEYMITDGIPSMGEFFMMIGRKVILPVVELFLRDVIYDR